MSAVPSRRARVPRSMSLFVVLLVALGALAAPAEAGGKDAPPAVVSKSKKAIKALKSATNDAVKSALLDLTAFDAGAAAGHDVAELADQLVDDLDAFSRALDTAVLAFRQTFADAASDALDGEDGGEYPLGLYVGAGGLADDAFADARKLVDKALDKLGKRIETSAALVAKSRHLGLVARVPAPAVRELPFAGDQVAAPDEPLRVTVLLTLSDLEASDDGVVALRGRGGSGLDVELVLLDAAAGVVDDVSVTPDEAGDFAFDLAGVPEGNLLVTLGEVEGVRRWDDVVGVR